MFVHKLRKQTREENLSFLHNFKAMLIEHEQDMFTFYESLEVQLQHSKQKLIITTVPVSMS
ncbi:hypothetical protein MGH68_14490 [Erysipelothrix sp. D19-032]